MKLHFYLFLFVAFFAASCNNGTPTTVNKESADKKEIKAAERIAQLRKAAMADENGGKLRELLSQ